MLLWACDCLCFNLPFDEREENDLVNRSTEFACARGYVGCFSNIVQGKKGNKRQPSAESIHWYVWNAVELAMKQVTKKGHLLYSTDQGEILYPVCAKTCWTW